MNYVYKRFHVSGNHSKQYMANYDAIDWGSGTPFEEAFIEACRRLPTLSDLCLDNKLEAQRRLREERNGPDREYSREDLIERLEAERERQLEFNFDD